MLAALLFEIIRTGWVAIALELFGIALSYHVVYNLYFHPLANVPGPLSSKLSSLPSFYHACRGDRHVWLWQLFQVYGSRVRPEPNKVLWCDPEAYADIYNSKANVHKPTNYKAWQRNADRGHTLVTIDKDLHARKRRLLNLSFTENSLRSSEKFIIKHVNRWNELLTHSSDHILDSEGWTEPLNFTDMTDKLVFDIMGDLCFGSSFEIKEPGPNILKTIPHGIAAYAQFYYPVTRSPLLPLVLWLKRCGLDRLLDAVSPPEMKQFFQFIHDSVSDRIKLQESHRDKPDAEKRLDMFHYLCEAKDPETGLPAYNEVDLRCEAELLIVAGSDTTSISLCGIFFYLTRYQHPYEKLVKEIRGTFKSVDEIVHGPKLRACTYLRACIDEGMRLTPSGPSELDRQVSSGGITINGDYYPEGLIVGTAGWCTSRNEAVYGDCNTFRPERWIPGDGVSEDDVARIRRNFHPFSEGPGNCVGKNLAILELTQTVARTIYRLDVRRTADTIGEGAPSLGWGRADRNQFQLRDAYISVRDGPVLQFRKRRRSSVEPAS